MRGPASNVLALTIGLVAAGIPSVGGAQTQIRPRVIIMVDTSGSMTEDFNGNGRDGDGSLSYTDALIGTRSNFYTGFSPAGTCTAGIRQPRRSRRQQPKLVRRQGGRHQRHQRLGRHRLGPHALHPATCVRWSTTTIAHFRRRRRHLLRQRRLHRQQQRLRWLPTAGCASAPATAPAPPVARGAPAVCGGHSASAAATTTATARQGSCNVAAHVCTTCNNDTQCHRQRVLQHHHATAASTTTTSAPWGRLR